MCDRDDTPENQRKWRESRLEEAMRKYVRDMGGIPYKFTSPGRRSVPDRLIVLPLRSPFWVEAKAWGQVPTDAQFREALRLLKLGQLVYFIDNMPHFKKVIDCPGILPSRVSPPSPKFLRFWRICQEQGVRV